MERLQRLLWELMSKMAGAYGEPGETKGNILEYTSKNLLGVTPKTLKIRVQRCNLELPELTEFLINCRVKDTERKAIDEIARLTQEVKRLIDEASK